MKKQRSTKYAYWKWVLLNKAFSSFSSTKNLIVIHNKLKNSIFIYDMALDKILLFEFDDFFDRVFDRHIIANLINTEEFEQFYKSLPYNKKQKFWKYI